MAKFRKIDYGKMLYETLRNYFSVNAKGGISLLYQYLACIIQPLISPFEAYDNQRLLNGLVADCKWQIGQLTNVLNYLFDPNLNRIYIVQGYYDELLVPEFTELTSVYAGLFEETATVIAREFTDEFQYISVIIYAPNTVNLSQMIAIIEQIRLQGIKYRVVTF